MNYIKNITLLSCVFLIVSCADYKNERLSQKKEKKYFSSKGFALIYEDDFYKQGIVSKRMNNDQISAMHSLLKRNTLVRIINPSNSKFVETKISKKSYYPKIFNVVVSKKVAEILELDFSNPYVEFIEIKKNKTFIAKETSIFDEEKNVAEAVPVDEIKMDVSTKSISDEENKSVKKISYILVISDFYYYDSAENLKLELIKKTKKNNFSIKKINNNKYRLLAGPFKNFSTLKTTYISLNNLGFEDLNIYKN